MDVELEAVGRKISDLRTSQGWRLADLAEETGYTTSYLSQIERGVSIPSLTALATVALALGVEMTALLDGFAEPTVTITRAGEGSELRLSDGRAFRTVTRLGSERPYTAMIQGHSHEATRYRHFGERFIFVLNGTIRMDFGDDHHIVDKHGTIHYGAHEGHDLSGISDEPVEFFIISSPALF